MLLCNFVNYVFVLLCSCIFIFMYAPFRVFCSTVLFYVLFVYKCVLYYCHRVLTNYHIMSYLMSCIIKLLNNSLLQSDNHRLNRYSDRPGAGRFGN
jgi:hypothetical protein